MILDNYLGIASLGCWIKIVLKCSGYWFLGIIFKAFLNKILLQIALGYFWSFPTKICLTENPLYLCISPLDFVLDFIPEPVLVFLLYHLSHLKDISRCYTFATLKKDCLSLPCLSTSILEIARHKFSKCHCVHILFKITPGISCKPGDDLSSCSSKMW